MKIIASFINFDFFLSLYLLSLDQNMLKGMQAFFNNKFAEANHIFSTRADR